MSGSRIVTTAGSVIECRYHSILKYDTNLSIKI